VVSFLIFLGSPKGPVVKSLVIIFDKQYLRSLS